MYRRELFLISVRKTEQIVGRNIEIARDLCDIARRGVTLVGFPVADNAKADIEVFCDGRLRQAALFS